MEKKTYYVTTAGMVDGAWREVNEPLSLTDREAKYLEMAGLISTEKVVVKAEDKGGPAKAEPSPVDLEMKTRSS